MQQHSGQHVLSAALIRLFDMPTVSFHLGDEACTIDLTATSLSDQQIESAEALANDIVTEDRPVEIRYVAHEEAQQMGLRKLPPRSGSIRLIDIHDFDLTACGGTHVRTTGQIGPILLRKTEKVRQGMRVEFVCGARAVRASRRDYVTLTRAAEVFSTHIEELPVQARKSAEELKNAGRAQQRLLEQLAEYEARERLEKAPEIGGVRLVEHVFSDRDATYAKLIAQKVISSRRAVALVGTTAGQPTIVLAATPGVEVNCGALLKEALAEFGGRGGGSREMAQGGVADREKLEAVIRRIRDVLQQEKS
jgi:alanyl-tRNA synthetase